jgi:hypothetical protein
MACQCYCLAGRAPHLKIWTSTAHSTGAEESQHHVIVYSASLGPLSFNVWDP